MHMDMTETTVNLIKKQAVSRDGPSCNNNSILRLFRWISQSPFLYSRMPSHIHYMHIYTGSLICMNNLGQDYCMQVFPDDQHARVHIYSLAVAFRIWSKPHYRSKSFQHDLLANLSNVAIPGTGEELE